MMKEIDFIDCKAISRRVLEVFEESGLPAKAFSEQSKVSETKMSHLRNTDKALTINDINNVIRNCSELIPSPEWLIFGDRMEGLQYMNETFAQKKEENTDNSFLINRLEELSKKNQSLEDKLASLQEYVESLEQAGKEVREIMVIYKNNTCAKYIKE